AGSALSISGGIKDMMAILFAYKERANLKCTIHFIPRVKRRDVIDMKPTIVQSLISDFILDDTVFRIKASDIKAPPEENFDIKWWDTDYYNMVGMPVGGISFVMRLELNKVKMFERRVSMSDLAKAIGDGLPGIAIITSPFEDAIIDIIPDDEVVRSAWSVYGAVPDMTQIYLTTIVKPKFKKTRVKGIPGIIDMIPIEQNTLALIIDPIRPPEPDIALFNLYDIPSNVSLDIWKYGLWKSSINQRISKSTGVRMADLINMIVKARIMIVKVKYNNF